MYASETAFKRLLILVSLICQRRIVGVVDDDASYEIVGIRADGYVNLKRFSDGFEVAVNPVVLRSL